MNQKKMIMKKIFSLLLALFLGLIHQAQTYKGNLEPIKQNSFHRISLNPDIRSVMGNNLDFVRIKDAKNNEIPFIEFISKSKNSDFQGFNIISNLSNDKESIFIIENKKTEDIELLTLKIANNDLQKTYSISGSNDQKDWFGLVNNQQIGEMAQTNGTFVEKDFVFPRNNYKFLKFVFSNKNSLPINVLSFGSYKSRKQYAEKAILQGFEQKIKQKKKKKKTVIHIKFPEKQMVDAILFKITSPSFYLRNATIKVLKTKINKNKKEKYEAEIADFQLNSKLVNQFSLTNLYEKEFNIELENQDNQPLEISKIQLFQEPLNIVADLKSGESYQIEIDSTLETPQYDLANFSDKIPNNLPEVNILNFKKSINSENLETGKSFWQSSLFMWICIVFAVVVILYFAAGMLKDMGKEE